MSNASDKSLQGLLESLSADALQALLEEASPREESAPGPPAGRSGEPDEAVPMSGVMPATQMQVLFWRIYAADPYACENHQSLSFHISGALDAEALAAAFQAVSASQPSLRTVFFETDGDVFQRIEPVLPIPFQWIGPEAAPVGDSAERAEMDAFIHRPFRLGEEPPIRVRLTSRGERDHQLQIVLHHIASDGRSKVVLLDELSRSYRAMLSGEGAGDRDRYPVLADWVERERLWLPCEEAGRAAAYWREGSHGNGLEHAWPQGREWAVRGDVPATGSGALTFGLSEELSDRFHAFAAEPGMSAFQLWVGTYGLTLQRLMPGVAVTIGLPVDLRRRTEETELVGCLMNLVPVTLEAELPETVDGYLRRVGRRVLEAMEHARLPWLRIREESLTDERSIRKAGWRTLINFKEDYAGALSIPGARVEALPFIQTGHSADLVLTLQVARGRSLADRVDWTAEPSAVALSSGDAYCLLETWRSVIGQCVYRNASRVADIDILLPGERERIRELSGIDNIRPYPDTTIHERFHHTASLHPQRPAVIRADGTETDYQELRQQARHVASFLLHRGLQREQVVAIHLHRSPELLATLLGILEAGGAFLLLEPGLPSERICRMLEQAEVSLLIRSAGMPALPGFTGTFLEIDDLMRSDVPGHPENTVHSEPSSLAYVIFTSGSTGVPKGAMVEHRNILNRLFYTRDALCFGMDDRTLQKSPLSFDVCLTELLLPMITGGAIVLADPDGDIGMQRIADLVVRHRATYLHFAPSLLRAFLEVPDVRKVNGILRMIRCGGESLPEALMQDCLSTLDTVLFQSYGPAEAAIAVTLWKCHTGHGHLKPPIGTPNANVDILLLDAQGRPVPPGLPGELWIGGAQTGRGYIHNPEETAKRFVGDPLRPGSGRRYYRTGDLARFLADGNLLFLGRLDDQVKVRGVRIEPGDVAAGLLQCTGVHQAVVLPEPDGEGSQRLRAWVTPQPDTSLSEAAIRAGLAARLPAYMVPFRIHLIDAVPLTTHGKTDHRALRALAEADTDTMSEGLPLSSPTELRLAQLWSQLLRVEVRYADADFFRLGGHSLLAMRLSALLRQEFGVPLPFAPFFADGRLDALSSIIDAGIAARRPDHPATPSAPEGEPVLPDAIPLHSAAGPGTLYFCAGGFDDVKQLVDYLSATFHWTWNVVYLPDPQLRSPDTAVTSLQQLGAAYAQTIRSHHAGGPIVLSGLCLHGRDAHATAAELERRTDLQPQLVLFDTSHPTGLKRTPLAAKAASTRWTDVLQQALQRLQARLHPPAIPPHRIHSCDAETLFRIRDAMLQLRLFDESWYRGFYLDVARAGVDPALHYVAEGWKEERMPQPWFHAETYAILEPAFRKRTKDPLRHFLAYGIRNPATRRSILSFAEQWASMINGPFPQDVFDAEWYRSRYAEVKHFRYPPFIHYLLHGWMERRLPSCHFDTHRYAAICSAYEPETSNPVMHYLLKGRYDATIESAVRGWRLTDRQADRLLDAGWFDPRWYAEAYPDTPLVSRMSPARAALAHFLAIGWTHGRLPFPDYSPASFEREFPGYRPGNDNPLRHLLALDRIPVRIPASEADQPLSVAGPSQAHTSTAAPHPAADASHAEAEVFILRGRRVRVAYAPESLRATLHVLANQHLFDRDATLGWTDGVHGKLHTHRLAGDHASYLSDDLRRNAPMIHGILERIFRQSDLYNRSD